MSEESVSKEEWLSSPFTRRMANEIVGMKSRRLETLLSACRKSQDPGVTAALTHYVAALFMQELFEKGEYRDG